MIGLRCAPPVQTLPPAPEAGTEGSRPGSSWQGPGPNSSPGAVEPVLCDHCGRTASNGIRCLGFCVADAGY